MAFVEQQNDTALAQHSDEWYNIRKTTVGGSEVAAVLGSSKELLAGKLGLTTFDGNKYTRWGTVLEPLTAMWCELFFKMELPIVELGSVVGALPRQRYSPDGVGIVLLADEAGAFQPYIVLFEFKAPACRIPIPGQIPKNYVPQIQTGMLSIPLTECCIFADCCYRTCSMEMMSFGSDYNMDHHRSDNTQAKAKYQMTTKIPYACGVICFSRPLSKVTYTPVIMDSFDIDCDLQDMLDEMPEPYPQEAGPIDLGTVNSMVLDDVFRNVIAKTMTAEYMPIVPNIAMIRTHELSRETYDAKYAVQPHGIISSQLAQFAVTCKQRHLQFVGFMPWKLMECSMVVDVPNPGWRAIIERPIAEFLARLDQMRCANNVQDAYDRVYEPAYVKPTLNDFF